MTARHFVAAAVAMAIGLPGGILAQSRGARDFDAEYRTAVAVAKDAAAAPMNALPGSCSLRVIEHPRRPIMDGHCDTVAARRGPNHRPSAAL